MSPGRPALALLVLWLGLAIAAAFAPALAPVWSAAGIALLLTGALDAALVYRLGPFDAERRVPPSLAVGVWTPIILRVHNRGARGARVLVQDHPPQPGHTRGLPRELRLGAREHAELEYTLLPAARGAQRFAALEVGVRSPLGLWRLTRRVGEPLPVRVYPDFRAIVRYTLLATERRTSELGIRRRPRRGEGLDFLQLREYRAGDMLRQIDWKVTSRLHKTISREYQEERDQQIVFLLDCGRKMRARDDELSHFDHALNSVLLLAHVALRQGDAVGLLSFSGERRWLAPRKGAHHLNPIMNAVYDLDASTRASDYLGAAQDLLQHVRKRALVVVVTNLRDEDHQELAMATRLLRRSHLVLVASLRERVLADTLAAPVHDLDDALRTASTHRYLESRQRAHDLLRGDGALALDCEPQQLGVALVNGYLDVKSRGLL